MGETLIPRRGNLTAAVISALVEGIDGGVYAPGEKLPSEQALGRQFGVSRTVVREAVASLRLGGRLHSRQGLGVFVAAKDAPRLAFDIKMAEDATAALQILELRLGVELEAVALAAQRRSPTAIADLTAAFDRCARSDGSRAEDDAAADLAFHLAIARATGNPHFPAFLAAVSTSITTDLLIKHGRADGPWPGSAMVRINREHGAILSAIIKGDAKAARSALRQHLEDGMARYRRLLEEAAPRHAAADRLAS